MKLPPPPTETVIAQCPEAAPIIDRSFKVQPPLCMAVRQSFRFVCTPDPAKSGYCKQTFADMGLSSVEKIADDRTCLKLVDEWIKGERTARAT